MLTMSSRVDNGATADGLLEKNLGCTMCLEVNSASISPLSSDKSLRLTLDTVGELDEVHDMGEMLAVDERRLIVTSGSALVDRDMAAGGVSAPSISLRLSGDACGDGDAAGDTGAETTGPAPCEDGETGENAPTSRQLQKAISGTRSENAYNYA